MCYAAGNHHRSARSRDYLLTAYFARDKRRMGVHMNERFNDFQWFVCRLCGFDAINRLQFRMHLSIGCFMHADRWDFPQVCSKASDHHEHELGGLRSEIFDIE